LNAVILLFPLLHITPLFISRQSFCWSNACELQHSISGAITFNLQGGLNERKLIIRRIQVMQQFFPSCLSNFPYCPSRLTGWMDCYATLRCCSSPVLYWWVSILALSSGHRHNSWLAFPGWSWF